MVKLWGIVRAKWLSCRSWKDLVQHWDCRLYALKFCNLPHPCYSQPMHQSAIQDYTCLSSAGCIQVSGALICMVQFPIASPTNYVCGSPFIARGKSLVKHVFNFGSVRQDLDTPNQIAERCLCHGHIWKKDCKSNLRGLKEGWLPLVQQAVDEATHHLSLAKCTQSFGEARSSAVRTWTAMQTRIVLLC